MWSCVGTSVLFFPTLVLLVWRPAWIRPLRIKDECITQHSAGLGQAPWLWKVILLLSKRRDFRSTAEWKFSIMLINTIYLKMVSHSSRHPSSLCLCNCLKSLTGLPVDVTYSSCVARELGSPEASLMEPSFDLNKDFGMLRGKKGHTYYSLANGNVGTKGSLW